MRLSSFLKTRKSVGNYDAFLVGEVSACWAFFSMRSIFRSCERCISGVFTQLKIAGTGIFVPMVPHIHSKFIELCCIDEMDGRPIMIQWEMGIE